MPTTVTASSIASVSSSIRRASYSNINFSAEHAARAPLAAAAAATAASADAVGDSNGLTTAR